MPGEVRGPKVDGSGIQLQAQNIGKGAFGKVKKVDPSGAGQCSGHARCRLGHERAWAKFK